MVMNSVACVDDELGGDVSRGTLVHDAGELLVIQARSVLSTGVMKTDAAFANPLMDRVVGEVKERLEFVVTAESIEIVVEVAVERVFHPPTCF